MSDHTRRDFIDGLRAVADFYEANPTAYFDGMSITLNMYAWSGNVRKVMSETKKLFVDCAEVVNDRNVTIAKRFSPAIEVAVFAPRNKVLGAV